MMLYVTTIIATIIVMFATYITIISYLLHVCCVFVFIVVVACIDYCLCLLLCYFCRQASGSPALAFARLSDPSLSLSLSLSL